MSEAVSEATRATIERALAGSRVVLFMKGTRRAPQCGFSAAVVELLDDWLDDYATVDVLADADLREGIKIFSDWPTIPQLYVAGEFVGGADILRELEQTGELPGALGVPDAPPEPPAITISASAAAQIRAAFTSDEIDEADMLRLAIDSQYRNDLAIGPRRPGDVAVETQGLTVLFDRRSARRAKGLSIDFVDGPEGTGFKIENPNAPPSVREIGVRGLAERMAAAEAEGARLHLYDVRTQDEAEKAAIAGAVLLYAETVDEVEALPKDTPLYLHCHHGGRSMQAAQYLISQGFVEVYNVTGGIDAWSREVDPSVPRY